MVKYIRAKMLLPACSFVEPKIWTHTTYGILKKNLQKAPIRALKGVWALITSICLISFNVLKNEKTVKLTGCKTDFPKIIALYMLMPSKQLLLVLVPCPLIRDISICPESFFTSSYVY